MRRHGHTLELHPGVMSVGPVTSGGLCGEVAVAY